VRHCFFDDQTEILTENGWKLFKDLEEGERVMTLNNETGESEWEKPMEYQEFKHLRNLRKPHPLGCGVAHCFFDNNYSLGKTLNPVKVSMNSLPLNSENLVALNNLLREYCNESIKGGFISKNIIPNDSLGGNLFLFKKSLSLVNITRCSDLALSNIFGSLDLSLTRTIPNPLLDKELIRPIGIFSSATNEISLCDKSFIFNSFRSQFETCKDSLSTDFWIIFFNNFFNCDSSTKKSYNILDKYSSIFECQVSSTDLTICNNILVNLNSHCNNSNNGELFKGFGETISFEQSPEASRDAEQSSVIYIGNLYNNMRRGSLAEENSQASESSYVDESKRIVIGLNDTNNEYFSNLLYDTQGSGLEGGQGVAGKENSQEESEKRGLVSGLPL